MCVWGGGAAQPHARGTQPFVRTGGPWASSTRAPRPLRRAQDGKDLAEAIIRKCPSKIDIGPVYSCNPQERLKYSSACGRLPCARLLSWRAGIHALPRLTTAAAAARPDSCCARPAAAVGPSPLHTLPEPPTPTPLNPPPQHQPHTSPLHPTNPTPTPRRLAAQASRPWSASWCLIST